MRLLLARSGVALLVISLVNCSAWHATQEPLSELEGKRVRITTKSGERQEGRLADADSLGLAVLQLENEFKKRYSVLPQPSVLAFDTTTITAVEKRAHSPSRTMALYLMIPVGLVLVLGLVAYATWPSD
jgi:hypothetical protein